MIHVGIRRRVAVMAIVLCLGGFAVVTHVLTRVYAPGRLCTEAQDAFSQATRLRLVLGKASVSVDDSVSFKNASVHSGNRMILSCGPVSVRRLPPLGGPWQPEEIRLSQVVFHADFSQPNGWQEPAAVLSKLLDKASTLKLSVPREFTVEISYAGAAPVKFSTPSEPCLEKRALRLTPRSRNAEEGFSFTLTSTEASLSLPLKDTEDLIARAIVRKAGGPILEQAANALGGRLAVTWNAKGETAVFTKPNGWILDGSAAKSLGFDPAGGAVEILVTSFAARNDQFEQAQGAFFYSADRLESGTLSKWLAAVGIAAFSGTTVPPQFENVRIAGEFTVRDGLVTVKPVQGKPGLVWCEAAGQAIVIFAGGGCAPLSEVIVALGGRE